MSIVGLIGFFFCVAGCRDQAECNKQYLAGFHFK